MNLLVTAARRSTVVTSKTNNMRGESGFSCVVKSLWVVECNVWVFPSTDLSVSSVCETATVQMLRSEHAKPLFFLKCLVELRSYLNAQNLLLDWDTPFLLLGTLDPRIWKCTTAHKNSISKALCLKHLKVRFFKTIALPKTLLIASKSWRTFYYPLILYSVFFFRVFCIATLLLNTQSTLLLPLGFIDSGVSQTAKGES